MDAGRGKWRGAGEVLWLYGADARLDGGLLVPTVARYELADFRLGHALGDLLGLVLAVDPAACPDSGAKGCC